MKKSKKAKVNWQIEVYKIVAWMLGIVMWFGIGAPAVMNIEQTLVVFGAILLSVVVLVTGGYQIVKSANKIGAMLK